MSAKPTIAVLGAGGIMGSAFARNLLAAGYPVRAWNRTIEKARPLEAEGASVTRAPRDAATGADVVLTMLIDADATTAAMTGGDGALTAAGSDAVWIQMATIGADGTATCAQLAHEHGLAFVDAPVAGTKGPAIEGTLTILASGDERARPVADPLFEVLGRKIMWLGDAGAGTSMKLVINSWLVTIVEGVAETLALAEGTGIDPQDFLDAVDGGPLDSGFLKFKGRAIIDRDFEPHFRLEAGAKDARLALQVAERAGLELPMLAAIAERMTDAEREHGRDDIAATWRLSAPGA